LEQSHLHTLQSIYKQNYITSHYTDSMSLGFASFQGLTGVNLTI
jgi:hypothetical protein